MAAIERHSSRVGQGRVQQLVLQIIHRKLIRNTILALLGLALLYTIYPSNGPPSASLAIMKGFKSNDPVGGVALRILPLGDSITEGYGSSDFNGYRLHLMEALTIRGAQARYIGALKTGTMENNENDGFPGWTIVQIAAASKPTWSKKPNVVLLHVGTNDMNLDPPREPYDTAPERLAVMLDDLVNTIPNVTIVVAQIMQSMNDGTKLRIPVFNDAVAELVSTRVAKGAKIQIVDMSKIGADHSTTDDSLHPNDAGYQLMSVVWLQGLQAVTKKQWLTPPID